MAKPIQYCKVKKNNNNFKKILKKKEKCKTLDIRPPWGQMDI